MEQAPPLPTLEHASRKAATLSADLLAGLTGAAAGIPQAMAFSLVAGLSPIHGLASAFVGTIVGALASSSVLLTIGPTNAVALAVGAVLLRSEGSDQISTLVVLTLLVGLFQALAGLLRLGSLTRYVSNAVMTGFISGAALLILLGQFGPLFGLRSTVTDDPLLRFLDTLLHLPRLHPQTLICGLLTMGVVLALNRSRIKAASWLLAIVAASLLAVLAGWEQVQLVRDLSAIPASLPGFRLPDLGRLPELTLSALAVALLGLVQSAGLARSLENPDGSQPELSQDFLAQGLGNLAVACLQGMPIAGSISRTAVNVAAGARSRLSNLFAGVLVGASLYTLGPLAGLIPLSALAAVLTLAAISLIDFQRIRQVWVTYLPGRIAMCVTFILTLLLPLEQSIYLGVLISLALYLHTSTQQVRLVQLVPLSDGAFAEAEVPDYLPQSHPLVLEVHGNLYFGAVYTLERMLPRLNGVRFPVVIFRLRGEDLLGSTFLRMLEDYARLLRKAGGRLLLTGLSAEVHAQLIRAGATDWMYPDDIICAHSTLLESTRGALASARCWQQRETEAATECAC